MTLVADRTMAHRGEIAANLSSEVNLTSPVKAFLSRPIEGDWPYLWIDATYLKVRRGGRIVSVAVIIAVGVNTDGRREVLGMEIGTSEAEPIWTELPHAS
jgi:transposase-like protein